MEAANAQSEKAAVLEKLVHVRAENATKDLEIARLQAELIDAKHKAAMNVCLCMYVHACMHGCMHAFMHVCVCVLTCPCTSACMHARRQAGRHACMYMHACMYVCKLMYVCMHACRQVKAGR